MSEPTIATQHPKEIPLYKRAQDWLRPALAPGSVAVDATCGNGHDTLFLCQTIGSGESIWGMDLQTAALDATRQRLANHNFTAQLFPLDHAEFEDFFRERPVPTIDAAIFNLGYLPGGDHSIVTAPDSTLAALDAIFRRASQRFRLGIVAYRGHPGGQEETQQVTDYLKRLPRHRYALTTFSGRNTETGPIFLGISSLLEPSTRPT